jgi:hypothetical protein
MSLEVCIICILVSIQTSLFVSIGLIAILYFFVIQPMRKDIQSPRVVQSQEQHFQENLRQQGIPVLQTPDNLLPSIDDLPEEVLYGDEKPNNSTVEEVEQSMASFNDVYSRLELDENGNWKNLSKEDVATTEAVRA